MAWPFWTCIFHQFWCFAYWCWAGSFRISWHECWEVKIHCAMCTTSTTSVQWRCRSEGYVKCYRLRCAVSPFQNSQVASLIGDLSTQEVLDGYRRERRRVVRQQKAFQKANQKTLGWSVLTHWITRTLTASIRSRTDMRMYLPNKAISAIFWFIWYLLLESLTFFGMIRD